MGNWKPTINDCFDQVKKGGQGVPHNPTIYATYRPTLNATESGSMVQLGITFTSGKIWLRDTFSGIMRPEQDVTGWALSIPINAGFAEPRAKQDQPISKVAQANLDHFTSAGFAVSRLFCDLQSVDLIGTGASHVSTGSNTNTNIKQMFTTFMTLGYLTDIQQHPEKNPYIFGYVAKHTSATLPNQEINVPDSLKPVGNTFNVFYDSGDPSRSTLNFILNTKTSTVGPGNHPPTDSFDTSWLSPTDISDGKMIYSFRSFLESLLLRPFYELYANKMHEEIARGGISLGPYRSYNEAMHPIPGRPGYSFDIYNVANGDDQYVNSFDASWSTTPTGITLNLTGSISWYKEKHKHVTILGKSEKARAWAGGKSTWAASLAITVQLDSGKPFLKIPSPELRETGGETWSDQNGVSKKLNKMNDLLGSIASAGGLLDLFGKKEWIAVGLMALSFLKFPTMAKVNGVALDLSLPAFSEVMRTRVMLPAGDVFYIKNVQVIPDSGATTMLVDYKEEKLSK